MGIEWPTRQPDRHAPVPLYARIKGHIKQKIRLREWQPGEKLPSENELVKQFRVSRMTVNRALRELTQAGLLSRVRGLGTFVASSPGHVSLIKLQDIAKETDTAGKTYSCRILQQRNLAAPPDVADKMNVGHRQDIYHLKAIHYQDKIPVQLENRYVNPAMVPDFLATDFTRQTTTHYLKALFQPDEIEHTVQAVSSGKESGRLLHINKPEPCLRLVRRTWKAGQVVTLVTMTYPSSRYELSMRYRPADFQLG